jgi:hypothetical protein
MRSLIAFSLLVLLITSGCRPLLPPEALARFAPERLPITQSVASALKPVTADTGFVLRYPGLRASPAPRWLRAGTRVTYSFASATYAQRRDDPTPSAAGLVQYDVIAQNRRTVLFLSSFINTQLRGEAPVPLAHQAALPGVGEFWFSPSVLENAEAAADTTFQVTRMPMTVDGGEFDVVRFQSNSATETGSGEEVWAFDSASGVLVFYRHTLYRADGSQSSGTIMSLLGRRQLTIPWRGGTVPDWVRRGLAWEFTGSQTLDVGVPPPISLPMSSSTRITAVGPLWSEHAQQVFLYGTDGGSSVTATSAMQLFGGYWLSPEALEVLESGMLLDEDPLTDIQIRVVQATRQRVVLEAAGPGHLNQLTYSARDGRLIAIYLVQQSDVGTRYTVLEATP